jgi:hypothetical protein
MSDEILSEFEERFASMISIIDTALENLQAGKMPDLGTLDSEVAKICRDVEAADPALGQKVQPLMAEMIGKLDKMAQALMEYQQKIEGIK